jgi:integrase
MSDTHSTPPAAASKPAKPSPDFPLFAHATGRWAKKIKGKMHYFGRWADPDSALEEYRAFLVGKPVESPSAAPAVAKPAKPSPDFPLFFHATGQWCKKIRGKLHYFGTDPHKALDSYLGQKDALHAGRMPRADTEGLTVKDLVNAYLNGKKALVTAGELSHRAWTDYEEACKVITKQFGQGRVVADLGPDDFATLRQRMANRWGPVRLGNVIQRVRSVFKYALDADLVDRPVRFGPDFKRPSAKTLRLHRAAGGAKLFTADEVRRLLDAADVQLRAMLYLGINCGFGMADCGRLPLAAIDLDAGWVDFPRPKTGIPRRCPLWPETAYSLRAALAVRHAPKDAADAGLAFLTAQGLPWHKEKMSSPMCFKVGQLLNKLGINGRKGLGFYTLRHTFRTAADEAKDQPAADYIMGHARDDMASIYRERISDDRLKAVAITVRTWLFQRRATGT